MKGYTGIRLNQVKTGPGISAVVVESIEVIGGDEFASVDTWLNRADAPQRSHLFHITYGWHNVESLQFCVDSMQAAD